MPYATRTDAADLYGADRLDSWAPAPAFDARLASAAAVVDGYLTRGGYATPVDLDALRAEPGGADAAAQLVHANAVVALHQAAVGNQEAATSLASEYREVKTWLEGIAGGDHRLPVARRSPHDLTVTVADPLMRPEIPAGLFLAFRNRGGA